MPTKRTRLSLIDDLSGEVMYENESTEFRSWQDTLCSDKGIHVFHRGPYIRIFPQIEQAPLSLTSIGCLIKVIKAMDSDNSLPAGAKLAEQIGTSFTTLNRYYASWKACGAIRKDDRRVYYVNPLYGLYGKWMSAKLYRLFQAELDPILPKWIIERFAKM